MSANKKERNNHIKNIEYLKNKLAKCQNVNIDEVDIEEVDDISNIQIDTNKSSQERILDFISKSKNPYLFRVGENLVKIEFSTNNIYASNCVTNVFKHIYK